MKEKFVMIMIFVIVFILLIDIYSFKGIRLLLANLDRNVLKYSIYVLYWIIPLVLITSLLYSRSLIPFEREPKLFRNFYLLFGFFVLFYIPKLIFIVFHLTEDIVYLVKWIFQKLSNTSEININESVNKISRAKFLSQIGLITAAIPFTSILYGMIKGRFNFKIVNNELFFNNLPNEFDGLRIVHISDIHIGSFIGNEDQVKRGIELINSQKPDLILFTGDLVNNFTEELNGWTPILSNLRSKYGKFSIMGNHDYGDYFDWENANEKLQNFNDFKQAHVDIGFKLLLNESKSIEINNSKISLIGVENWGLPPFLQYGNIQQAMSGTEEIPFKILMSHDPSHWDAEIVGKKEIDLTLSGHTHGMQFGIKVGNLKWSPIKYKYPRWSGLYKEKNQFLYVNQGFGFIGFPGRVGMPPEITVLELRKA